jgi:hypothetical protein
VVATAQAREPDDTAALIIIVIFGVLFICILPLAAWMLLDVKTVLAEQKQDKIKLEQLIQKIERMEREKTRN